MRQLDYTAKFSLRKELYQEKLGIKKLRIENVFSMRQSDYAAKFTLRKTLYQSEKIR